jgi:hypothetical protein
MLATIWRLMPLVPQSVFRSSFRVNFLTLLCGLFAASCCDGLWRSIGSGTLWFINHWILEVGNGRNNRNFWQPFCKVA